MARRWQAQVSFPDAGLTGVGKCGPRLPTQRTSYDADTQASTAQPPVIQRIWGMTKICGGAAQVCDFV